MNNVPPSEPHIRFIATSFNHSCAISRDEARNQTNVACWGDNSHAQCDMPPQLTGVEADSIGMVRTGMDFSCVHLLDFEQNKESITCWGDNSFKQTDTPDIQDIRYFDAGARHACALYNIGFKAKAVLCWGANLAGQATAPQASESVWHLKLATGFQHSCAIQNDLRLNCWGWHTGRGQDLAVPDAKNLMVTEVTAGYNHNCVITTLRTVKCFGGNE